MTTTTKTPAEGDVIEFDGKPHKIGPRNHRVLAVGEIGYCTACGPSHGPHFVHYDLTPIAAGEGEAPKEPNADRVFRDLKNRMNSTTASVIRELIDKRIAEAKLSEPFVSELRRIASEEIAASAEKRGEPDKTHETNARCGHCNSKLGFSHFGDGGKFYCGQWCLDKENERKREPQPHYAPPVGIKIMATDPGFDKTPQPTVTGGKLVGNCPPLCGKCHRLHHPGPCPPEDRRRQERKMDAETMAAILEPQPEPDDAEALEAAFLAYIKTPPANPGMTVAMMPRDAKDWVTAACRAYAAKIGERDAGRIADLEGWKASAMKVMNGVSFQEVGDALNLPLGVDIGPMILPGIKSRNDRIASLESQLADSQKPRTPAQGLTEAINERYSLTFALDNGPVPITRGSFDWAVRAIINRLSAQPAASATVEDSGEWIQLAWLDLCGNGDDVPNMFAAGDAVDKYQRFKRTLEFHKPRAFSRLATPDAQFVEDARLCADSVLDIATWGKSAEAEQAARRIRAPITRMNPNEGHPIARWPESRADKWCGEFKARQGARP